MERELALILTLVLGCLPAASCVERVSGRADAGTTQDTGSDSPDDCPPPLECVSEFEAEMSGCVQHEEYFCGGSLVCCETDGDGDTDTDTDTDVCEYLHDLVQSLCGPVLPQMIECCQTQWDEILDMDVMVECIENASDCYDVMDCDTLAAYCHPGDCPAALLDCPGFTGDPWQIYDAWLCASWLMSSEYSPYWLRICDLGECVPEHVITYELCGPDGFEVCEGGLADPDNGLCWQNAPDPELRSWFEASEHCEGLTLEGYDDWRLPTVGELRTLIQGWPNTETDGPCGVSDECYELSCWSYSDCDGGGYLDGPGNSGCYWSPALSGYCHRYWTQSLFEASGVKGWYVDFNSGAIDFDAQSADQAVRCVRVLD